MTAEEILDDRLREEMEARYKAVRALAIVVTILIMSAFTFGFVLGWLVHGQK